MICKFTDYQFSNLAIYITTIWAWMSVCLSVVPSLRLSKKYFLMVAKKWRTCHIYIKDKNIHFIFDYLDQICPNKVIIEKSRCGRFLWNRNWDLDWIWANWQYWKKCLVRLWATFEGFFFHVFRGKKMSKNFLKNIVVFVLESWSFIKLEPFKRAQFQNSSPGK